MRDGARRYSGWMALVLGVAGCFDAQPSDDNDGGAAPVDVKVVDVGAKADAGNEPSFDVRAMDTAIDTPAVVDDAPPPPDVGEPVADVGPGCTSSAECSEGRLCGPDGRCVACLPADDRCPTGQYCDPATFACSLGCRADSACAPATLPDGGTSPARCDLTRHVCLDCNTDDDCAVRSVCRMGQCQPGCNERRGCATGEVCCEGSCVDVQADIGNCGSCSRRCAAANGVPSCVAGVCGIEACTMGFADCNAMLADGCEADLRSDATRCGTCSIACATPPGAGTVACAAGRCGYTCAAGMADCDGDPANGCERAVSRDASHCGRCNNVCPARAGAAMPRCDMGVCGVNCNAGLGDCDGDAANGCETSVRTSVAHCGACGTACPVPAHATATCTAGRCGYTCAAGFGDCDGDASNGCEADLRSTADRCGTCTTRCTVAGGTPACVDGACTIAACGSTFADCDGNAANGCESNTRTSAAHCGACGRGCSAAPNTTATCSSGTCGTQCVAGFGDCDGNAANGCEVDLRASVAHCGTCGNACAPPNATAACSAGVCAVASCNVGRGNCDANVTNGCETDLATSATNCGACGVTGAEVCDGRDNSCDGAADEGCPTAFGGLAGFDYTSPEYGALGSAATTSATCPAGQVVRGFYGRRQTAYVSNINVICGTPTLVEDRSVTPHRYTATVVGSTNVGSVGPSASEDFRYVCPGDGVVTRIFGRATTYHFQFGIGCSTLSVTGNPGNLRIVATPTATSPAWGTASGTAYDYTCPSNATGSASVLRGLFGRTYIFRFVSTSVAARCAVPALTLR